MKKTFFITLILLFTQSSFASECGSLFEADKATAYDAFSSSRKSSVNMLRMIDKTTHNFRLGEDIVYVGDVVSLPINSKHFHEIGFSPVEGKVLGSKIITQLPLDQMNWNSKISPAGLKTEVYLAVYDKVQKRVVLVSQDMITTELAEIYDPQLEKLRDQVNEIDVKSDFEDNGTIH